MTSINTNQTKHANKTNKTCHDELTDTQNIFFPSSSALIPVCTILPLALLYMLTHDKRRIHKLKPVFKIKSLYNEKRLPQVPVSFCKKCLRNVSLAVSPHYIFFVIGNTNVIASRRKNIGKTTLCNSNYITRRHFEHFLVVSPQYGPPGIR